MKNIHILPTDKPSRLYLHSDNELQIRTNIIRTSEDYLGCNQHIYITSNEESKEKRLRFIIDNREGMYGFIHQVSVVLDSKICPEIILTTDQDLIKDGVQAIDDEFLEWFVKNPSCEEVEVIKGFADSTSYGFNFLDFSILKTSMKNKQTAVDWLFKELCDRPKDKMVWYYILEKAKQMEKEQILNAYCDGYFANRIKSVDELNIYYDETYGKNG